jgi:hypothetical protein
MLKHHSEPAGNRVGAGNVLPFHRHPACIRYLETRQKPQRGGFAAPAGPQQRDHLPLLD